MLVFFIRFIRWFKEGGKIVFTTPNVLSLKSRIRYFLCGFHFLFWAIPVGREEIHSTMGHISPISYFFLAHAMAEAGFKNIELKVDKYQRSAILPFLVFYPLLKVAGFIEKFKSKRKAHIDSSNEEYFDTMNSADILMLRTIIVCAEK